MQEQYWFDFRSLIYSYKINADYKTKSIIIQASRSSYFPIESISENQLLVKMIHHLEIICKPISILFHTLMRWIFFSISFGYKNQLPIFTGMKLFTENTIDDGSLIEIAKFIMYSKLICNQAQRQIVHTFIYIENSYKSKSKKIE